jgi:YHS domain-containing protein
MGLIRVLMIAVAGLLIYSFYKKLTGGGSRGAQDVKEDERLGRLVQDPQCHVYVDSKDAVHRKVKGGDLFFCSEECAEEYIAANQPEESRPS